MKGNIKLRDYNKVHYVFTKFMKLKYTELLTFGEEFKGLVLLDKQINPFTYYFLIKIENNMLTTDDISIGSASTLTDIVTTIVASGTDITLRKNVSIDLKVERLNAVIVNNMKHLLIACDNTPINETMSLSTADLYDYDSHVLLYRSRHTKAYYGNTWI
jgi:hypothetical protein